jgi:tyrosinase
MANGLTIRPSVEGLERDPETLAALRDAYGKMQELGGTDNRSWIYWAGIHGFSQFMCWHHGRVGSGGDTRPYNLFLPWHRAYLLHFEHAARDQNSGARLPWWDWTSANSHKRGVPKSFSDPKVGNDRNPLYDGPVPPTPPDPARNTVRFPGPPGDLPTAAQVNAVLSTTTFADLTVQIEDIHDQVHGWTGGLNPNPPPDGGDMGVIATAAYDPIFWAHHCMIDRLWYLWQLGHGVNNIPPDYLDMPLAPFAVTVQDVLDINRLGYEYAQSVTRPSAPGTPNGGGEATHGSGKHH